MKFARVSVVLLLAGVAGCAAETATEDELILERLETLGVDTSNARFEGGDVIIEGDMVLARDAALALAEEYDDEPPMPVVEKGYWHLPTKNLRGQQQWPQVPQAKGIWFDFSSSVPTAWRDALSYSLKQWDASHECISAGSTRRIEVVMANLPATVVADARLPIANRPQAGGVIPGTRIRIGNAYAGASAAYAKGIALHELGHALGFMHPWEGSQIPRTQRNTSDSRVASYPTVMDYSYETSLQADDKASVNVMFEKVRNPRTNQEICR